MAIQQSTTPATNLTKAKYEADFTDAQMLRRLYDQFATAVNENGQVEQGNFLGTSYYKHFLSDMLPSTTAISETSDITPQTLVDATSSISPTSRADAIQWAEAVELYSYTPWGAAAMKRVGKAAMETLEILAINAALAGELVIRNSARASLDHDTAGDLFTEAALFKAASVIPGLQSEPFMGNGRAQWLALFHSDLLYDLIETDNILSVAKYQDKEILFNGEVGQSIHGFKLLADAQAKVFLGAGADADSNLATTLNGAIDALATSLTATSGTNLDANSWFMLGTEETSTTFYEKNERLRTKSSYTDDSTAVTFIGSGANGGCRFPHANGVALRNADNAYPVLFGSPNSMVKMYTSEIGPFAKMVGPKYGGLVDQFKSLGFKWHGGYGLAMPQAALRGEYAATLGSCKMG
jgi:hypothetical protein